VWQGQLDLAELQYAEPLDDNTAGALKLVSTVTNNLQLVFNLLHKGAAVSPDSTLASALNLTVTVMLTLIITLTITLTLNLILTLALTLTLTLYMNPSVWP